jgi:hypothetical protein
MTTEWPRYSGYSSVNSRYTHCHQSTRLNSSSNSLGEFRIVALSKNQALNQHSSLRTSLRNSRRMREMGKRFQIKGSLGDRDPRPPESQHTSRIAPVNGPPDKH